MVEANQCFQKLVDSLSIQFSINPLILTFIGFMNLAPEGAELEDLLKPAPL
jgi:hypothetical protein